MLAPLDVCLLALADWPPVPRRFVDIPLRRRENRGIDGCLCVTNAAETRGVPACMTTTPYEPAAAPESTDPIINA